MLSEEYKIIYKEYEIVYTTNEGMVNIEIKDNETGKIYHSKFKLFKVIKELQQENQKYKEVIDKAREYINKMFETGFYNDDYYLGHLNQILQDKEVE